MRPPLNPLAASTILCLTAAATILTTPAACAATIYVDSVNGNDAWSGLCETWDGGTCGPKRDWIAVVHAAGVDDIIRFAPGDYPTTGVPMFSNKDLTLISSQEHGAKFVPVGGAEGMGFSNFNGRMEGFIFHRGRLGVHVRASGHFEMVNCRVLAKPFSEGLGLGGSHNARMSIRNCVIDGAGALRARGMSIDTGAQLGLLAIDGCTFSGLQDRAISVDRADIPPFDIRVSNSTFNRCASLGGDFDGGGAIKLRFFQSSGVATGAVFESCIFDDNRAAGATPTGGAIQALQEPGYPISVIDCSFSRNLAEMGGAIYGAVAVDNCTFVDNIANSGGALFLIDSGNTTSTLVGSTFSSNHALVTGGAIQVELAPLELRSCTMVGNSAGAFGGGISSAGFLGQLTDSILWENADSLGTGERAQIDAYFASVFVSHSNIQGWTGTIPGVGSFDADPLFADPANDDYHLLPGSPCIDAGALCSDGVDQFDLDSEPRVMNGRIDIGADEFTAAPFLDGDLNCDGFRTVSDIAGFVLALTDPAAYAAAFPACNAAHADINRDGVVTVGDISNFVVALTCGQ